MMSGGPLLFMGCLQNFTISCINKIKAYEMMPRVKKRGAAVFTKLKGLWIEQHVMKRVLLVSEVAGPLG